MFQNLLSLIPSGRPDTQASVLMLEVGRWCLMKELIYKPFEKLVLKTKINLGVVYRELRIVSLTSEKFT